MTALWPIAAVLVRRLLRPRRLLGLVAITSVTGLIFLVVGGTVGDGEELFSNLTVTLTGVTLPVAALLIGSATLGEERRAGTLPYLYLKPVPRWIIALAAWVAASAATLVVATAGWFVAYIAFGVHSGDWAFAAAAWLLVALAAVGYAAVFVPLGYVTSRAVIAGLAYIFVWEWILGAFITGLAPSSIWRTAVSAYAVVRPLTSDAADALQGVTPGVGGAVAKLAVLTVISVALLATLMRARDAV